MKKVALGLPLVLVAPLLLLMLGMGNANIQAVQAACATNTTSPSTVTRFGIGTLNWRDASRFAKPQDRQPGERPSNVPVPNVVAKIGASGSSIVGFEQLDPSQAAAFLKATGGRWDLVRRRVHGHAGARDAIAYEPSAWSVDEVRYVSMNFGGTREQSPLARFTSTKGAGSVWVLNTHNPANVVGGNDTLRDSAVTAEAKALRQLTDTDPGTPVLFTGDMNDRARFKRLFLSLAGQGWSTADPGGKQIGWIMGGPGVTFSGAVVDPLTKDSAHNYTDRPLVHALVSVGADTGSPAAVTAGPGGTVTMVQANLPSKPGFAAQGSAGIRRIVGAKPDFITLNEQSHRSLRSLTAAAAGYDGYRDPTPDPEDAGGGAMENVVMWNSTKWKKVDAGWERLITKKMENGHVRSRYATWVILQSRSNPGAQVAVIATHFPVNPEGVGGHGGVKGNRGTSYGNGMDNLVALADKLAAYAPVLIGGDFNNHPYQTQSWAAVPHMTAAGYRYSVSPKSGIDYVFYAGPVRLAAHRDMATGHTSDHPYYNVTRLDMNGAGPSDRTTSTQPGSTATPATTTDATSPGGCPPCPETAASVALPNVPGPGNLQQAELAAAAAYQAGFRGEDLVTAVAIARVESGWNPTASNGTHFGLWQIAASHQGMVAGWNAPSDIFDPDLNADYAYALYQGRAGSGEAKFADWLPFEKTDYHQYLDRARQAVATATGDTSATSSTSSVAATCTPSPMTVVGQLSTELSARINAMEHTPNGLCGLSWTHGAPCTFAGQCPKVVDALYGGPGVGRGYGNGQNVAQGIINDGLAQEHGTGLDPLPPVGAVVSYNRGDGVGHVAIYVGNGKIFGNDYGCSANGVYGCVGFADVHTPAGSVTWALPKAAFDLGGMPAAAAA